MLVNSNNRFWNCIRQWMWIPDEEWVESVLARVWDHWKHLVIHQRIYGRPMEPMVSNLPDGAIHIEDSINQANQEKVLFANIQQTRAFNTQLKNRSKMLEDLTRSNSKSDSVRSNFKIVNRSYLNLIIRFLRRIPGLGFEYFTKGFVQEHFPTSRQSFPDIFFKKRR